MDNYEEDTFFEEATEQVVVADIIKDGVNVARMPIGIGTIKTFRSLEGFSVPEGCTLSLRVFHDTEEAEKYVRGLE